MKCPKCGSTDLVYMGRKVKPSIKKASAMVGAGALGVVGMGLLFVPGMQYVALAACAGATAVGKSASTIKSEEVDKFRCNTCGHMWSRK